MTCLGRRAAAAPHPRRGYRPGDITLLRRRPGALISMAAGRSLAHGVDAPPPPRPRTRVSNGAPPPPPVRLPLTGLRGPPLMLPVCTAFDDVTDGTEDDTVPAPACVIPPIAIMATPAAAAITMASLLGMDVSSAWAAPTACPGQPGRRRDDDATRRLVVHVRHHGVLSIP